VKGDVRYLILSDIHANIEALEAVLAASPADSYDRVLVLGDLVGYGADPNAVVDRVRALDPLAVIRGNHDKAACGLDDGSNFNQVARFAAAWTSEALTAENRQYLQDLPAGPAIIDERVEICHGAPFDEDHYIFDGNDARRALDSSQRPLCLFGHTHLPVIFFEEEGQIGGEIPHAAHQTVPLREDARFLVNVGSVGQPRDGDPRAGYATYDAEGPTLILHRVPYPVELAQRKIVAAGLPHTLANRLAIGR
jgi:diadenosine tetraphosphatase ApaH/serine/threonine PP2A family protein phosphatase